MNEQVCLWKYKHSLVSYEKHLNFTISLEINLFFNFKKFQYHQEMHNRTIHVFFLLLSSYMFQHCRHLLGAYIKMLLKHTTIIRLNSTYICFDIYISVLV